MRISRAQFARCISHALAVAAAAAAPFLLTTCGGGGGGGSPPPPRGLTITTTTLFDGTSGQSYSMRLTASGGTPPYTWGLASDSGPLPADLNLSVSGTISGTPTSAGVFAFSAQVKDTASKTAIRALSLNINPSPLTITTTSLPDAIAGQPYSLFLTATGGNPPYSWSLGEPSGSLPPGLTLNGDGLISGVPATAGGNYYEGFAMTFQVKDSSSKAATTYLVINLTEPFRINSASLPDGNFAVEYQGWISFSGGIPPWHWSLAPGSNPLPGGLSLGGDGGYYNLVSGTPTQPGTYSFTVQGKDSGHPGQTATSAVALYIGNRLTLPSQQYFYAVIQKPFDATPTSHGGTPPFSWSYSGYIPSGLSMDPSTGRIKGTPSEQGNFFVVAHASDSSTPCVTADGIIYLYVRPPLDITKTKLNDGVKGGSYWDTVDVSGGLPPFTLEIVSGSLPPGVSPGGVSSQGANLLLSGVPTELGEFHFSVKATDSLSPPDTVTADIAIHILEPLAITTTILPNGLTGDPYSVTLTGEGGLLPYNWYVNPPLTGGLTVDKNAGRISGVPSDPVDTWFSVSLYDSANPQQWVYKNFPLKIVGRLVITSGRMPNIRPSIPVRLTIGLTGGTAPYAWKITSGALPSGLNLSASTGQITGTPTTEGISNFTVQVTDAGPPVQTTSKALSLTIKNDPGRNDSIPTATPISNGTFRASISPHSDPVDGPAVPDSDYYALTANPGAAVTVETKADRLVPASPLDSVIEIVDAAGNRLSTCRPGSDTYGSFTQPCLNDDFDWYNTLDSKLYFQVPGSSGTPVTFYVHVLDWRGSARPDYVYDLVVSGAN